MPDRPKLSMIIAKAESLNLMVSNATNEGLELIFASECLAEQFCEWAEQYPIGLNAPYGTPRVTVTW